MIYINSFYPITQSDSCQNSCDETTLPNPSLSPPTSSPTLSPSNDDGAFTVTLPSAADQSVYLVRAQDPLTNVTYYYGLVSSFAGCSSDLLSSNLWVYSNKE